MRRLAGCLLTLALLITPGLGLSQEGLSQEEQDLPEVEAAPPPEEGEATREEAAPAEKSSDGFALPIYVPAARGDTPARVGGATRGVGGGKIEALAPDHLAFTTVAQPVLWWYQPEVTSARVDFILVDTESPDPLVDVTLRQGAEQGVYPVPLAEHGVRLEPGRAYQWLVALVPNPRSRSEDVVSGGLVQRVAPGPELSAALESAPASSRWRAYARYGVWYEALNGISEQIRKQPGNRSLRNQRAQLLRDGKLAGAAAWDRAESRAPSP